MAQEKVSISRITHFDKDKDGNALRTKAGKPYTRCLIDLTDGRKVSGFGNSETNTWKEGSEVEIDITQSGQYWNFSTVKKDKGGFTDLDRERLRRIEDYIAAINSKLNQIYKHLNVEEAKPTAGSTNVPYPEYEQPVDFNPSLSEEDIPF